MSDVLSLVVMAVAALAFYALMGRPWWTWLRGREFLGLWGYLLAAPARRQFLRGLMLERREREVRYRAAAAPVKVKKPRRPAVRADWHLSGHYTRGMFTASFEAGSPPAQPGVTSTRYEAAPPGVSGDVWEQVRTGHISRARFDAERAAQREIDLAVRQVQQSVEEVHRAAADMARRVASGELSERRLTMYPDPLNIAFEAVQPPDPPRPPRRPRSGKGDDFWEPGGFWGDGK